mmetsp:Transcript_19090/g.31942  ORF Transcript_19090/g.31942 Transcript_19090/m.31942 type:complete len:1345 (-) Transcript_19090:227-4261(-)
MVEEQLKMNPDIWGGLLPKEETQSFDFLKKNPNMDGRGIVVAVLDTGVDPGAIGLQTTTEGLPKVIDIIDCTGSGDVTMHGPVEVDGEGHLKGKSGRKIIINPAWTNPTGKYHVGIKKLNELYTKGLRNRMKKHRKEEFDKHQKQVEKQIKEKIALSSNLEKADQDDLTAQLSVLREMGDEQSAGIGAVIDCVVFHDGDRWQAVVDCSATGDMSTLSPMSDFNHKQEFRSFTKEDCFNFGVHIYDEGKVLSIVVDTGAHGTHVAGIIAAHHPEQPEINGVAPGAQIVSLKIGDTRIDSGETAPGLIRALLEAIRLKVNIINMSFGEAAQFDNTGAFVKLAEEMVYKHGITFVSSAGNNGPAVSTVGAPMASCIVSVGAFVTKSLMRSAYSIHEANVSNIPESNFTWSSVGPVADGDMGVSLMAPGGATTCVPLWTLSRNQLMNGTSMSSPNACGCFTLLLSGLKQMQTESEKAANGFIVSTPRLRLAVENECKYVNEVDVLGQNNGLLQVENAWNHLMTHKLDASLDIPVRFEVLSRRFSRGIYLRQPSESAMSSTFKIEIKPQFALLPEGEKEMIYFGGKSIQQAKIDYEMRLSLVSSCDWVKVPGKVLLVQAGKVISVQIDPTKLSTGVHVEFIRAYDESNPSKGSVFKIPITIVKPEVIPAGVVSHSFGTDLHLPPTDRIRRFLVPPPGCSFIDVIVKDKRISCTSEEHIDDSSTRMVVVHALQLLPGEPYRDHEKQNYLHLAPSSEHVVSFAVEPNVTLELTMSRFWNTLGEVLCDVNISFRGVTPHPAEVIVYQGQKVNPLRSRVRLQADLHACSVLPAASLTKWSRTVNPKALLSDKASRILPLGERDVLPNGNSFYQLVLEYNIEIEDSKNNTVTPRWPVWNEVLYESPFSGQFYMIYDSQKQLVSCGDAYADRTSVKLPKGHYTVRLQVKHDDAGLLETYDSTPMVLERQLDSSIKVPCYGSQADALLDSAVGTIPLFVGTSCSVIFGDPAASSLPSSAIAGDVFHGNVTYLKSPSNMLGCGTRPSGYPITFVCTGAKAPAPATSNSCGGTDGKSSAKKPEVGIASSESSDKATVFEMPDALRDTIRDAKLKYLAGVGEKDMAKEVLDMDLNQHPFYLAYTSMVEEYPEHVALRLSGLSYLMKCASACAGNEEMSAQQQKYLDDVMKTADEIFDMIDKVAIVTELGVLVDDEDASATKRRKEVKDIRNQLIKALATKCRAIIAYGEMNNSHENSHFGELYQATYKELSKWEDVEKSDTNWELVVHKNKAANRYGLSLKRLNEIYAKEKLSASPSSAVMKKVTQARMTFLRKLNWQHIIERIEAEKEVHDYDEFLPF